MRVLLDRHQVGHAHRPVLGDSAHVVAAEVDEHQVLGALLLIGDELGAHRLVLFGRSAAPPRPGDRTHGHLPTADAHEKLRRAADQLHAVEDQVVHVRRRIDHPEGAIQRFRREIVWHLDPPRQQNLKGIAGDDVFANALHVGLELRFFVRRRSHRGRCVGIEVEGRQGPGRAQSRDRPRDLVERCVIGRVDGRRRHRRRHRHADDDAGVRAQVVDDHQRAGEDEQRVRCGDGFPRRFRKLFDQSDDVIREVANRAAPELTGVRQLDRARRG